MIESKINTASGHTVSGFFHGYYYRMKDPRNTMKYLTTLKNDIPPYESEEVVHGSKLSLAKVLLEDFPTLVSRFGTMTVCGVPRSKRESDYAYNQMGLKQTIRAVARMVNGLEDGMDFIIRHTDTVCTHRAKAGYGGEGEFPRPGLIKDTCNLSSEIKGRNILLVDDIYTPNVGIDEDAIEAMFEMGAKSVVFYAVGHTMKSGNLVAAAFGIY